MTAPPPELKSLTATEDQAAAAGRAEHHATVGARKGAAEGVATALRPVRHPTAGPQPVAWLHITAPGRGATPTAHSKCACGRDRSAVGHRKVAALVEDHDTHRTACPLRAADAERTAA